MIESFASRTVIGAAALLLLVTPIASSAATPRRVAVLEFTASWSSQCANPNRAGELAERCEALLLLTDEARSGALDALRPPAFIVMTRENTAQLLKEMGSGAAACAEGECEVETARLIGAELVISGQLSVLEGTWIASVKLHDVRSAALLGTGRVRGKTKLELLDAIRIEVERIARRAGGVEEPTKAASPMAPSAPAAFPVAKGPVPTAARVVSTGQLERGAVPGMVLMPGGSYTMGETKRKVTVAPFMLDVTEVTAGAYAACVKAGKCNADWLACHGDATYGVGGKENHPVTCVSWSEAANYCAAVGKRLPTEEEWEWAARGTERGAVYPWGNEAPGDQLCWNGGSVKRWDQKLGTCAVGSYPKGDSPQGVKDLAGNAEEWTSSGFNASARVGRGGGWYTDGPALVAASYRDKVAPGAREGNMGFRCARSL